MTGTTKDTNWKSIDQALAYYSSQHTTLGCKITHMIGVPMIVVAFVCLFFNWTLFIQLELVGWFLQLIGHFVFEHNTPVILEAATPSIFAAALIFVWQLWRRLFLRLPL
jgi:hypothetical protein